MWAVWRTLRPLGSPWLVHQITHPNLELYSRAPRKIVVRIFHICAVKPAHRLKLCLVSFRETSVHRLFGCRARWSLWGTCRKPEIWAPWVLRVRLHMHLSHRPCLWRHLALELIIHCKQWDVYSTICLSRFQHEQSHIRCKENKKWSTEVQLFLLGQGQLWWQLKWTGGSWKTSRFWISTQIRWSRSFKKMFPPLNAQWEDEDHCQRQLLKYVAKVALLVW